MSDKKTVELYYDVLSPYSWFGFEILERYVSKWKKMDLKLKPVSLGDIMKASDNQPPGVNPIKMQYIGKDLMRLAKHTQIPMKIPSNPEEVIFKKGSKSAMLFVTAVDIDYPEYTEELSRQFWMRVWSRDEGITEDAHFTQAAKKAGMKDDIIKKALKRSKDKDVADRLQAFADEARANGAFGAPTMIVHVNGEKEMLFGSDRFNILAEMLGEKYDGPQNQLSKNKA
ncbi:glutathione S-transferase kappa 1-like [Mytilus trossulus]|uniref:glutathione S-transferase kappa 1-like n=1 Tax=Mytilus trossulus TaxID=6551 RepID=UPI00300566FB